MKIEYHCPHCDTQLDCEVSRTKGETEITSQDEECPSCGAALTRSPELDATILELARMKEINLSPE